MKGCFPMRLPFSVRALLLFAAFLLAGSPTASRAQSSHTVSGAVTFDSINFWVVSNNSRTVVFVFTSTTTPHTIFTRSAQVGVDGAFSLTNIPANSYTVWIKSYKWLAKNVTVNAANGNVSGVSVTLPVGDANNDNSVDSFDMGLLIGAFNTEADIAGGGYDDRVDFDCDGYVDSSDWAILIGNYNAHGDDPPFTVGVDGPTLLNSVIWDLPAPDYGAEVVPIDGLSAGGAEVVPIDGSSAGGAVVPIDGSSAGGAVNLTSGVYENHPGADLSAFNPVGPDPAYVRTYHSGRASQGYGSPGLSPGWIDNYDYTIFAPPPTGGGYGPLVLIYPNGAMDRITTPTQPTAAPGSASALLSGGACLLTAPDQVPYFVTGNLGAQAGYWANLHVTFADNTQMVFSPVGGGLYRYTALVDLKRDAGAIGRTLAIHRNANGSVDYIANDDARTVANTLLQFTYSTNRLSAVTDVNGGRTVQYDYWNNGASNGQLKNVYQITPVNQPGPADFLWRYSCNSVNTWTLLQTIMTPKPTATLPTLPTVTLTYDGGGRVSKVTDENGRLRLYAYSPNNDGRTTVTVPTDDTIPVNLATAQVWTQMFSRNRDAGTSQAYLQAPGNTATARPTTYIAYAENNPYLISAARDANGAVTYYTYDAQGNLATVTEPVNDGAVSAIYAYNSDVNPLG